MYLYGLEMRVSAHALGHNGLDDLSQSAGANGVSDNEGKEEPRQDSELNAIVSLLLSFSGLIADRSTRALVLNFPPGEGKSHDASHSRHSVKDYPLKAWLHSRGDV